MLTVSLFLQKRTNIKTTLNPILHMNTTQNPNTASRAFKGVLSGLPVFLHLSWLLWGMGLGFRDDPKPKNPKNTNTTQHPNTASRAFKGVLSGVLAFCTCHDYCGMGLGFRDDPKPNPIHMNATLNPNTASKAFKGVLSGVQAFCTCHGYCGMQVSYDKNGPKPQILLHRKTAMKPNTASRTPKPFLS